MSAPAPTYFVEPPAFNHEEIKRGSPEDLSIHKDWIGYGE